MRRSTAEMAPPDPLRIGISCFPSVGGSGTLATALGQDLAARGHDVHFICYERPFRLLADGPRLHFHPVVVNDYDVLKFPDYTLPLSVRMAEVSRDHRLDLLHVHYAVPHATPAILHALTCSDAVTAVSASLRAETERVFDFPGPIEVIHNFFVPRPPRRSAAEVRRELGVDGEVLVVHSSNLRPGKRIDLLLETVSRVRPRDAFKLLVLAGESFAPYAERVRQLEVEDRLVVREKVTDIEEYLQAADIGLFTSDTESFCLSILEAMCFGCPSVSTRVGGIPEVVEDNVSGVLVPAGDARALAGALESLIHDPSRRRALGESARARARELFAADVIVPRYEALYRRLCR